MFLASRIAGASILLADVSLIAAYLPALSILSYDTVSWPRCRRKVLQPTTLRTLFELRRGRQIQPRQPDSHVNDSQASQSVIVLPTTKDWYSGTEDLIEALGEVGREYQTPKGRTPKADLSYVNPLHLELHGIERAQNVAKENLVFAQVRAPILEVKAILARYLKEVAPVLEHQVSSRQSFLSNHSPRYHANIALLGFFDKKLSEWLDQHGWDATDLMNWTWILTASSALKSIARYQAICGRGLLNNKGHRKVPLGLFLFLLRRQNNNARGLELLLDQTWRILEGACQRTEQDRLLKEDASTPSYKVIAPPSTHGLGIPNEAFVVIVIRLLRQVRKLWPAATENVANLFCHYMDGRNFNRESEAPSNARLAYIYNVILGQLAIPSPLNPFLSVYYQQRAQYNVLRRMNEFEPPLDVDRRGYRAFTKTHLMHKKTSRERDWAQLKAKSWPPWKENKLGIHADIGPQHGISLAKQVSNRAKEAGYGADQWDMAATVLSGWDVDGSPTIQTRASLGMRKVIKSTKRDLVWLARVRATRTLDEAWAVFLKYKDTELEPEQSVYNAMAAKIVKADQSPIRRRDSLGMNAVASSQSVQALPGDFLEILPSRESPREAIYVRTPPPTSDEFLQHTKKVGVKLNDEMVAAFLINVTSIAEGIRYLNMSQLEQHHISALLGHGIESPKETDFVSDLGGVSKMIFVAFIAMLCRCAPDYRNIPTDHHNFRRSTPRDYPPLLDSDPLLFAVKLALCRQDTHRPPWMWISSTLARPGLVIDEREPTNNKQDILCWYALLRVVRCMDGMNIAIDLAIFRSMCMCLEKALFAAERMSDRPDLGPNYRVPELEVLSQGLSVLKERFKKITSSGETKEEIPPEIINENLGIDRSIKITLESQDSENRAENESEDDYLKPNGLKSPNEENYFTPPGCRLPRLLEVPKPHVLHLFIRVLGLGRDYAGLLDLIKWMAVYADELNPVMDLKFNGERMIRSCMTATRVFLERSWCRTQRPVQNRNDWFRKHSKLAPRQIRQDIREIVDNNPRWGGWPTDQEVKVHILKGRFR